MTIPSNPLQPSPSPSIPPSGPQGTQPPTSEPTSYVDPSGAWAKFLSTSSGQATAQDVQMFMNGLLKMFSIVIQQQQEAAKRAADKMKQAAEGD